MKYWKTDITIDVNGDYSFTHHHIIQADTLKEATEIMDDYIEKYYPSGEETMEGCKFEGYNGTIATVCRNYLTEITKEEWMEEQFKRYLLKAK